ncbi:MAG: glycosyltransferase family 2 protein [Planctomycetota bacterium]|nr:MAG: glycosyltransferase family 2 protein [Planctomycetota bacterium]
MYSVSMKLSIIIVNWNVCELLEGCLRSIFSRPPSAPFEVIVVDNASSDDSVPMIKREFPEVAVIENSGNPGFAAANNQGIKEARGQYLMLLNPDTRVHADAFDIMIRELDADPSVGACGPKILNPDGSVQMGPGSLPTFRSLLYSKTILRKTGLFRRHYLELKKRNFDLNESEQGFVNKLSGAAVMLRSEVFDQIGLLDESFFMYYEDTDLFYRAMQAGWKPLYLPDAKITHIGGQSSNQISAQKKLLLYQSLFIFLRKHVGTYKILLFSLAFKPAFFLRVIGDLFTGIVCFLLNVLLNNKRRTDKNAQKTKEAFIILTKYAWSFLTL